MFAIVLRFMGCLIIFVIILSMLLIKGILGESISLGEGS